MTNATVLPTRVTRRLRAVRRGDQGMTLVEVLISMSIFVVLITMTAVVSSFFFNNEGRINRTYEGFSEILPASQSVQNFLRVMVEPAPNTVVNGSLIPVPPFVAAVGGGYDISPNAITFTANVGDPDGPALVTITTTPNSAPYPTGVSAGTYTVTATEALPNFTTNTYDAATSLCQPSAVPPVSGTTCANTDTCPDVGTATGTGCTWNTTAAKTIFSLNDVTNGSATATNPIFEFWYGSNTTATPYSTTAGSPWMTAFGPGSCKTTSNCPVDQISRVQIELDVEKTNGLPASYQTAIYPISIPYSEVVG